MLPYELSWVPMTCFESLCVLMDPNWTLCVPMGPYKSLCVLIDFNVSLWVVMGPYISLRILKNPFGSILVLKRLYGF